MKPLKLFSKIYKYHQLNSSNIYAFELAHQKKLEHGDVVWADQQEKGKGLKGSIWQSEAAKNLTFSFMLKHSIEIKDQFLLNKMVALGLKNFLDSLSVGKVAVKWPNDLLVDQKKIAGTLIENSVSGNLINYSIIGIGLNVNQLKFPDFERKATSIALLSGKSFELEPLLTKLLGFLEESIVLLESNRTELSKLYQAALYGFGIPLNFSDRDGNFVGTILSVLPDGRLQLNREGKLRAYDLKELKFRD